ncbi:MAG: D-alanyl-D-alanine carboxypeptidase/D-alanyl-D-alanine-endopeptidase, partial [Gemmatimonadota bacterium]
PPVAVRGEGPAELRRALGPALDRLFDSRPFHRALWGVEVVDARTGAVLYERNPERHFVPASNMKLLVAATALEELGPAYTYRTSLYTNAEVRDGAVLGDLILYGRGDPNISGRYAESPTAILEGLADSLAARGVRRIEGALVADESFFDADYTRPDWEAYDLLWWYAAPVSALSFHDNSIDFTVRPGPVGSPPVITAAPSSAFYSLRNAARTVARLDSAGVPLDFTREPGTNRVVAYGDVAADAEEDTESFSVVNPAAWTATVFREVLEREGISVAADSVRSCPIPRARPWTPPRRCSPSTSRRRWSGSSARSTSAARTGTPSSC